MPVPTPARPFAGLAAAALGLALLSGCGGGDASSTGGTTDASSPTTSATASDSASTSDSTGPSDSASTGDSSSGSGSASPYALSTATGDDFAGLSGQEIADSSKAAMLALSSVHYQGSIDSGGSAGQITLDVQAKSNGDCTGTVGIQGGTASVLAVGGSSWFKADKAFWHKAAGAQANQVIKAVGRHWVLDTSGDFGQFCQLDQFLGSLFSTSGGTPTYTTQGTSTLAGDDVVAVQRTSSDSDGPSTGYIETGPQHYLVKLERTKSGKKGSLSFSEFDQDFSVQAPAANDVVDPSTLG